MGIVSRFRSSIAYPIAATLVMVTVVPVIVVGLILADRNRDHLTTLEKQYLTRQAVDLAAEVQMFLTARRARLEGAAAALSDPEVLASGRGEDLLALMAREDGAFLELALADHEGKGSFVRSGLLDRAGIDALSAGMGELGAAVLASSRPMERLLPFPGKPGAWLIARPLGGDDGRPWGVLTGAVDLAPLVQRFRDESLRGLIVSVVDGSGTVILSSRAELEGKGLSQLGPVEDFLRLPVRLTKVYTETALPEVGEVLGSVAPVEGAGWAVLVERPAAEAFATVTAMQRSTLVLSVLAGLVALGVGVGMSRYLTRPIQGLAEVSSRIAEGHLAERAEVSGRNEIARLAENFNQMAGSVEDLVRRLKQALRQNQELFLETIRTLAAAIDAKDPYTRGHSERVSSYSMAIARHLGMGQEEVFRVRIAAILHDVGKLGVRDDVLNKAGGLSPDEFDEIKRHPAIGAQIMQPIRLLKDVIPGIRNHHERWDGSGYPDGLRGEDIPMVARIIAVADTFDAMTTNRPYQKALSLDYVLAKMREMAGTGYDPTVVEALLQAVDRGDITPPSASQQVIVEVG
jgi:putative nucleotidyltransferase with HDIG domain